MRKMIRTVAMAAAMFAAVTTVAKAQGGGGGGGRGGRNPVTILKDSLHVSDAILAKADSIVKAAAAESAPLMEAARGGDADARTKMRCRHREAERRHQGASHRRAEGAVRQAHDRRSSRWTAADALSSDRLLH